MSYNLQSMTKGRICNICQRLYYYFLKFQSSITVNIALYDNYIIVLSYLINKISRIAIYILYNNILCKSQVKSYNNHLSYSYPSTNEYQMSKNLLYNISIVSYFIYFFKVLEYQSQKYTLVFVLNYYACTLYSL